ncbi:methyl-accepting chemotaxis protein [Ureibacillus aquaedulcis]|uniref:Methyl-accepting chemotaxis protein n=1 Tax=Ureibacillus aquaedulcis TaxID=3058421 RepID=A0ABT8GPR6_9BACL|nr:methyl-accepting chemotaxis protein [Ureibacillus sp. BA0131]MDN4493229.1 methyl-accepting chemotaxis protein [Ureibacillus sp. BA0131]
MKKTLKFKLLLTFSGLLLLTCLIMSSLLFRSSMNLVKDSVGEQVTGMVENVVEVIDLEKYKEISIDSVQTDYYDELRETLNRIREMNNITYLFTMAREQKNGDYEYYYVVDGLDKEDASEVGEVEESADTYKAMMDAFETGEPEFEMTSDEYGSLISVFAPIKDETGEIIGVVGADIDATDVYHQMDDNKTSIIVTTLVILIIGLFIIYFITEYLTRPLKKLTSHVEEIGKGNLLPVAEISKRQDEIGVVTNTFGRMVDDLRNLIQGIQLNSSQLLDTSKNLISNSDKVSEASKYVTISVQKVSEGASTLYNSSKESTIAIEQISGGIQQVSVASENVLDLSNRSLNNANVGSVAMDNVIDQINVIDKTVKLSSNAINELKNQSQEISTFINLIQDISNQTNLLALNASIEAARAGENGKGFAVVADEVRKLANQTEQATASIVDLISNMNRGTNQTVESMSLVSKSVAKGIETVGEAKDSFTKIVTSIQNVASYIKEVSATLAEMAASSEQLASSVEESTQFAYQTANYTKEVVERSVNQETDVNEISNTIELLTNMSRDLDELIKKFKL